MRMREREIQLHMHKRDIQMMNFHFLYRSEMKKQVQAQLNKLFQDHKMEQDLLLYQEQISPFE